MGVFVGLGELLFLIQIGVARGGGEDVGEQVVGIVIFRIRRQRLFAIDDCLGVVVLFLIGLGFNFEREALVNGIGVLVTKASTAAICSSGVPA